MRISTTHIKAHKTDKPYQSKGKSSKKGKELPRKLLVSLCVLIFWVLIWQIVYMSVGKDIIIPSVIGTFGRMLELFATADFWLITFGSVGRILSGYLAGMLLGLVFAILCFRSRLIYHLLKPIVSIAKATPVASLTVIIIVWVTNKSVPLFVVGLMVFPMIWGNTFEGLRQTDKSLLEMSHSYSVSPLSRAIHIYAPSVYPYFVSGASTALGFAWKSGIAAEILGSTQGSVGQQLNTAKVELDSEGKFAWTIVVILLSILFERVVVWMLRRSTLHIPIKSRKDKARISTSVSLNGFIKVKSISKSFSENPILTDVSFELNPSCVTAIKGVSGAGKTTLLRVISGLEKPDSGEIVREGGISYLFQENRLINSLTARENILFVNRDADADDLLSLMELEDYADMYPDQLSGGMSRRLSIARVLAGRGSVALLDEPFTALDEELRDRISERVFERLEGRAVALITHDSKDIEKFAQAVVEIPKN